MEQLFTNRKFHFCYHRNFRVFFLNGKRPSFHHPDPVTSEVGPHLDSLQSAFSLKIRPVLISASAIANHDVTWPNGVVVRKSSIRKLPNNGGSRPWFSGAVTWQRLACEQAFSRTGWEEGKASPSFPPLSSLFFPKQREPVHRLGKDK